MAHAVLRADGAALVGVADLDENRRIEAARAGATTFANVESMLQGAAPDVVYVATPTPTHVDVAMEVVRSGTTVVCEKPLTTTLDSALDLCAEAERLGVVLLVGCTHSYDAPVRLLRRLVVSGDLGRLQSVHSTCHTNWLARPARPPSDLDPATGGGLPHRQGAHQLDIVRYVCGGEARRVHGWTSGGHPVRAFGTTTDFAGSVIASTHYVGIGGFDTALLTQGVGELGEFRAVDEVSRRYFLVRTAGSTTPMFGLLTAAFEGGEVVATSNGLLVYQDGAVREIVAGIEPSGWDAVLAEVRDVLAGGPAMHSGRWGAATLELTEAALVSAGTWETVELHHQTALPDVPALQTLSEG